MATRVVRRLTNTGPLRTEKPEPLSNSATKNGFAEAIGYGSGWGENAFGLPGTPQGFGSPQQVSDTTTIFNNLRWYLISNFRQVLSEVYVEIGLIQTVVDVPVDDGLRGGVDIKSKQLDETEIKKLKDSVDRDDDLGTVSQAAKWNRLFGGAGIIVIVGDQDPESPLDLASINSSSDVTFRAVDMWELFWDKQNTEGYDPEIQTEEFEFYDYYAEKIHKSRVMRLKGLQAPSFIRPRLRGWGFSIVEATVRSINQYLKGTDLTFEVLDEFKIDVYKIKNLVTTLLSPNGTNKVKERVAMANYQKNYQNAVVMDSEDDWDHKQLSFAGLAEAQKGIRQQVAADLRMPITKLFGSSDSSASIGNADQNDMENYNSMVESQVRNKLKYDILRLLEIKCQCLFGFIPDDLEIEFKPLRVLTAEQEENVKEKKFNRVQAAADSGRISQLQWADACNKGNLFDIKIDTSEDGIDVADPEAGEIIEEGTHDPKDTTDSADPGANREDSRSPEPSKELSSRTGKVIQVAETDHSEATPKEKEDAIKKRTTTKNSIRAWRETVPYTSLEKVIRVFNSAAFDKASYEADGGDDWISPMRKPVFTEEMVADTGLLQEAKQASQKSFGKEVWQFCLWWYKKHGGKISG